MMAQNLLTVLGIVIVLIAMAIIYHRMYEPRSMETRMDAATEELKKGNLGNASDTLNDRTPADQLQRAMDKVVKP